MTESAVPLRLEIVLTARSRLETRAIFERRIELQNAPFSEIEEQLFRLL